MLKKLAVLAAGLVIAAPVLAEHRHHRYDGHHWRDHYRHRPKIVVPPPTVIYPPAPVYYYYYAPPPPPAPVYYAPPPLIYSPPQSGISVRLHFPL